MATDDSKIHLFKRSLHQPSLYQHVHTRSYPRDSDSRFASHTKIPSARSPSPPTKPRFFPRESTDRCDAGPFPNPPAWYLSFSVSTQACYSFSRLPIWDLALNHRNSHFAFGGLDCRVYFCNSAVDDAPIRVFSQHHAPITRLCFTQNDVFLLSADEAGEVRMTDVSSGYSVQ